MAHFDDIYEVAADNYGLVTFAEAKEWVSRAASSTAGSPRVDSYAAGAAATAS